jgi:adenylate cyclase
LERRLAAILAADVVGYTRLMGEDETGTLQRLKSLRKELVQPTITERKGRIVKLMGDGLLADFPSVVEAVQCAVDIQESMIGREPDMPNERRIRLRIGINLGDIIVDGTDIYGDGVNVAARLEALASPGGICISGPAFDTVYGKLDVAFEDVGERRVKNVAKPIRVYRLSATGPQEGPPSHRAETLPLPDQPSIAVLPFTNMSGDPEQDYFSDGITEDIITELSRFRSLFVIARNSSFTYKGQAVKVQDIGADLGVQYLVEGSVRKSGDRARITVQLVEAATGNHVWAHRYDRDLEDIFAVQDEVTRSIVATLPGRLEEVDAKRAERKHTDNLTAYDYVLRGNQYLGRLRPEDNANAQRMYEMAISLDPQYAHAHARLSAACFDSIYIWSMNGTAKAKSLASARKAHALDNNDSWSHASLGRALFLHKEDRQAEIHLKKAIDLNPNEADTAAFLAEVTLCFGRPEESLDWSAVAMRLNPHYPDRYRGTKAEALYLVHDYEQAVRALMEMTLFDHWDHRTLTASYGQLGRIEEAQKEWALFLAAWQANVNRSEDVPLDPVVYALEEELFRRDVDRQHWLDGLRKAGVTE